MKFSIFFSIIILLIAPPSAYSGDVLIASGHTDYPPFMWKAGNEIIGVGVELTAIIFEELGIAVDAKYVGLWKRVQHEAKNGSVDVIVGIFKNEKRLKYLAYPDESYTPDPIVIFVQKGKAFPFTEWKDLIGKSGGSTMGESFGQAFDTFAEKNLDIHRVLRIEQGLKMLSLGRLDYVVYGLYPGRIKAIEIGLKTEFDYLTKTVITPPAYQAFSKKSQFLKHLPYFNKRIAELRADGTIGKLIEKYIRQWEKTFESQKKSEEK
jgi:polar amino acid transport system substrate-binding protein